MSRTLDVNILVYGSDEASERHQRARALLSYVAEDRAITYLFWPVLLGYLRIITNPRIVSSPLDPTDAIDNIDGLVSPPQVIVPGEGARFWEVFKALATELPLRGELVPDAHLVALMREHGVTTIWTNDRDFRKFDGISVRNPFDARYADRFA